MAALVSLLIKMVPEGKFCFFKKPPPRQAHGPDPSAEHGGIDSECGACAVWLGGDDLWLVLSGYIHRLLRLRIQLSTPHRGRHTSLFLCQLGSINKNPFSCYFVFLLFLVAYIFLKTPKSQLPGATCITQEIHHLCPIDLTSF